MLSLHQTDECPALHTPNPSFLLTILNKTIITVVWEIFVVKYFRVTIFRELIFRFRGHPRNLSQGKFIVHEDKMDEYGRALCVRGYHVYREI